MGPRLSKKEHRLVAMAFLFPPDPRQESLRRAEQHAIRDVLRELRGHCRTLMSKVRLAGPISPPPRFAEEAAPDELWKRLWLLNRAGETGRSRGFEELEDQGDPQAALLRYASPVCGAPDPLQAALQRLAFGKAAHPRLGRDSAAAGLGMDVVAATGVLVEVGWVGRARFSAAVEAIQSAVILRHLRLHGFIAVHCRTRGHHTVCDSVGHYDARILRPCSKIPTEKLFEVLREVCGNKVRAWCQAAQGRQEGLPTQEECLRIANSQACVRQETIESNAILRSTGELAMSAIRKLEFAGQRRRSSRLVGRRFGRIMR
eukprot:COSAG01_NODE_4069_length_5383_cov_6.046556_2_plen_316_part_00